jgi:hypothetical protein
MNIKFLPCDPWTSNPSQAFEQKSKIHEAGPTKLSEHHPAKNLLRVRHLNLEFGRRVGRM